MKTNIQTKGGVKTISYQRHYNGGHVLWNVFSSVALGFMVQGANRQTVAVIGAFILAYAIDDAVNYFWNRGGLLRVCVSALLCGGLYAYVCVYVAKHKVSVTMLWDFVLYALLIAAVFFAVKLVLYRDLKRELDAHSARHYEEHGESLSVRL